MRIIVITGFLILVATIAAAQLRTDTESAPIRVALQHESEQEALMAAELRALLRKYNLQPWILTPQVLIDENQIPHSHPILTIHTRHIGDELSLLATFIHEQLHWLEEQPWVNQFHAAMDELEQVFPDVPASSAGGAQNNVSTYRHLLVCELEFQALSAIVGESAARETLGSFSHYEWIYEQVLNDPRVRQIALRHGFNVSAGARIQP